MANYKKTYDKKGNVKLRELSPEEAIEYIDRKQAEEAGVEPIASEPASAADRDGKEAQLLGSTKEAIALRKAEIDGEIRLRQANLKGQIDTIRASETAKERAGKHLAVFGALYLCTCTIAFLFSMSMLNTDSIAVAATLITLVVTQLSSILKTVVETKEPKDPVELMSEIVHVTLGNEEKEPK
tara:strand:- start:495 stop:1043 length:549 start_codon:yes stop_codon:yes gene_type:complete